MNELTKSHLVTVCSRLFSQLCAHYKYIICVHVYACDWFSLVYMYSACYMQFTKLNNSW